MGIPGLAKFIENNSESLKPFKLRDCHVIIDGNNLVSYLLRNYEQSYSAFGGDYDLYYNLFKSLFQAFQKCNVTPIVVFDGGHEKKKMRTVHRRFLVKLDLLKSFKSFSKLYFPAIFAGTVFLDVLREMNVAHVRCDFEADNVIAATARILNCPVISYDSDFFILDVLYIPSISIQLEPTQDVDSEGKPFYIDCNLFNLEMFLVEFNLKKEVLPYMAVLIGNDFTDKEIFQKFFAHVGVPKNKKQTQNQKKIAGVISWLQNEDFNSAQKYILLHIPHKHHAEARLALDLILDVYKEKFPPEFVSKIIISQIPVKENYPESYTLHYDDDSVTVPRSYIFPFHSCKIPPFTMDILILNSYHAPIQIEDMKQDSSHSISLPIISAIFTILSTYSKHSNSLTVVLRNRLQFRKTSVEKSPLFNNIAINELFNENDCVKQNILFEVLGFDDSDKSLIKFFDNNWVLFVIAVVYWMKNVKLRSIHVAALLICALNNFVQTHVGSFKSYSCFMSAKAGRMNKLSKNNIVVSDVSEKLFSDMLSSITELEYLIMTKLFIKLRHPDLEVINSYSVATVHIFSMFQSCLYYIICLNALLNFPFPTLKLHQFFSGTFVYNLHFLFKQKKNVIQFVLDTVIAVPNIRNICNFLFNSFAPYVSENSHDEKKNKEQRSQRKKRFKNSKK